MDKKITSKSVAAALGASFALSLAATPAMADTNPFGMQKLDSGYMTVASGKCGEGKCGGSKDKSEGKCGEGKCGGSKDKSEGKCGEGKCGGSKGKSEGKCGEGKCGGK